jgi:hypothetical protein
MGQYVSHPPPSFEAVVKLARALGVDCTAFADCEDVGGIPEKPKPKQKGARSERPRGNFPTGDPAQAMPARRPTGHAIGGFFDFDGFSRVSRLRSLILRRAQVGDRGPLP